MNNLEQLNNEGVNYFLNGNMNEAKLKYNEVLTLSPAHATTLNNLGMVYLREKDYANAAICFEKANAVHAKSIYLINLGHVYACQNKKTEAKELYKKGLELDPISIHGLESLSNLCRAENNFNESAAIREHIFRNISHTHDHKLEFVKDLIALKEFHRALEILGQDAFPENYENIDAYYLAVIQFNLKNFGLANQAILRGLALSPDNEAFRMLAATICLSLSDLRQALVHWDWVLQINSDNNDTRTNKAVALLGFGFSDEALAELNIVLSREAENPKALYYKALILGSKNENREADAVRAKLCKGNDPYYSQKAQELKFDDHIK